MKIIVSGFESGIGFAVKSLLEEEGFNIVSLDLALGIDVTDNQAVNDFLCMHSDAIGLICCAGIGLSAPLHKENSADVFNKVINVNLHGTFNCIDAIYPHMRENPENCSIVNVSSIWGLDADFGLAGYVSSKWAVRGLTHTINKEGNGKGVFATCVNPTYVSTPLVENLRDDIKEKMISSQCPTGNFLTPEYVASQIVALLKLQLEGVSCEQWIDKRLDGLEDV